MNAIVPARPPDETKLVRFASGGVAADVRLNEDGRNRSTSYALHLAAGEHAVNGRLVGVLASGDVVELGSLDVAPGSVAGSHFAVALGTGARFTGVFLEIRSSVMMLRVAAPQPVAPRKPRALYAGVVAAEGVVAVAGGAAVTPFLPGTPLLAAPSRAVAGEIVTLPYETHGLGSARFSASLDDRTTLASGPLDAAHGEIAVAIPQSAVRKRVSVVLEQRGPFGRMERVASFLVAAPPQPRTVSPAARVIVFSARRERGSAGESVLASYLAVGEGGTLAVSNAQGQIVVSAPFSHRGTQRLTLPDTVTLEPVLVRLSVRLGSQRATAAVDLPPALPLASAPIAPPKTNAVGADDLPESVDPANDPAAAATSAASEMIAVVGRPVAGRSFTVEIRAPAAAMRLRLEDDAGSAIEDVAVPDGARRVTLLAPAGGAHTYYLTCTYGRGKAQEVVVRSVRVRAP